MDYSQALAEVRAAFDRYEAALNDNDVAVLNELFFDSPDTIRYGPAEVLYGHAEISAYRSARDPSDAKRRLLRVEISVWSNDFATANCEYLRIKTGRHGRQSQTWMRTAEGWKVIAAHVSFMPERTEIAHPPAAR